MRHEPLELGQCLHVGVAGGGLVDIGLVDDEEDLEVVSAKIHMPRSCSSSSLCPPFTAIVCLHSRSSVGGG